MKIKADETIYDIPADNETAGRKVYRMMADFMVCGKFLAIPVIVMCNGSGTPLSKYPAVAKHMASWGFLVIGTEENYSWNALGAEMCLRYLERWNENEKIEDTRSIFHQKIDFNRVGIVGHSQGGVGVINAVTDTAHKNVYKAAVSLSPTNKELAHNLLWDYDASLIQIRKNKRHLTIFNFAKCLYFIANISLFNYQKNLFPLNGCYRIVYS